MTETSHKTHIVQAQKGHPLQAIFAMTSGFVPWIIYWILVGNVPFRIAVSIAFILSLGVTGFSLLHGRAPKVLEVGSLIIFFLLLVFALMTNDVFLERWIQPISNAGLLVITLGSLLIGKPFTLQYAREHVTSEVAETSNFLFVNRVITWIWVVAFAIMTASAIIPPSVESNAALTNGSDPLSIIYYWIIPFSVLGLAGLCSSWLPNWFARRFE